MKSTNRWRPRRPTARRLTSAQSWFSLPLVPTLWGVRMRLTERYRPRSLSGLCGQQAIPIVQAIALRPFSCCMKFTGPPGTGKTTAALALANDLGCDQWSTIVVKADSLGLAEARELMRSVRFRPMTGQWTVIVIEELTRLSAAVQRELQVEFDPQNLPSHVIVIATTNDDSGLAEPFRQRFGVDLEFTASQTFAKPAIERLERIWADETGESLPTELAKAGWEHGETGKRQFSMRVALDRLQLALLARLAGVAA